ncbi:protein kinase [Achlya hypogyna]|uniref:Protein kinase n=1 Tax=Achlya hypogyna TaxID=1202772 RepID=A0A1V9Y655_ACHHY|nr:protein kinase [Achlya hypogyna]
MQQTEPTSAPVADSWLGPVEPRSYRRLGLYYLLNWTFALLFWLGLAMALVGAVLGAPVLFAIRGPLRRRRVLYKAVASLWDHEICIANVVLRTPLRPISHWDLTHDSIAVSCVYFTLWKGLCVWLLASVPVLLLALDTTGLPPLRTDLQLLLDEPHPLVYRVAVLAYCGAALYVCDLLLTAMVAVTTKTYMHVFESSEAFCADLAAVYEQPAPLPHLTTYSHRRDQTPWGAAPPSKLTGKTFAVDVVPSAPTPPAMLQLPPTASGLDAADDDEEKDDVLTSAPRRRLLVGRILATSAAAAYDRLSPPFAARAYDALSPPRAAARGVYRALPPASPDEVHFSAYGPVCVGSRPFALDIWAFLAQQRDDVRAAAIEASGARALSREALVPAVAQGALVHVTLDELPSGFALTSDTATHTFVWTGAMERVSFVLRAMSPQAGHCLFKATIVVGHRVSTLRMYVLAHPSHGDDEGVPQLLESTWETLAGDSYHEIAYADLEMHELIGAGAGGDVYRAKYKGDDVVVKRVRASEFGSSGDDVVSAFRHEAAVLDTFGRHPRVVPFVGACSDPAFPLSLVTAFVPHGSLEASRKRLSPLQKDLILADIASAAATIHGAGFVHRDLAARNCLVDASDRGLLADFGLCRRVGQLGGAYVHDGSGPLKYMAPEALTPPYTFTPRSDAFAFGVLLWETLADESPFASLSPVQAAVRVLEGGRLPMLELNPRHQALLQACFQEDPMLRPSMEDIYVALMQRDDAPPAAFEAPGMVRRIGRLTSH